MEDDLLDEGDETIHHDTGSDNGDSDSPEELPVLEAIYFNATINLSEGHVQAELFDSGCTCHISPYCDQFTNFIDIPPKQFHAANKQNFSAPGMGDLTIDLPNGTDTPTKLHLTEVLYSPEVGFTLISVGKLDEAGFKVAIGEGKCVIEDPEGGKVGEIPRDDFGLYHTIHKPGLAHVVESVTLEQLHRWMGHISVDTAKKLVERGWVTGLKLD